jgi:hypothetical protein
MEADQISLRFSPNIKLGYSLDIAEDMSCHCPFACKRGNLILLFLAKEFLALPVKPKELAGSTRLPDKILSCSLHPNRIFVIKIISKNNRKKTFSN